MTQIDLFPLVEVRRNFYGLVTGGVLAHDSAPEFYSDDFQQLDAPCSFPLGAHQAIDILSQPIVFSSVSGLSR